MQLLVCVCCGLQLPSAWCLLCVLCVCGRGGSLPAPPRLLLCAIHSLFLLLARVIINKESNSHVKVIHSYSVAAALTHKLS